MPELSERTCLHVLVRGIRYRSRDKHRRWYFPSSRMSRIKKVWSGRRKTMKWSQENGRRAIRCLKHRCFSIDESLCRDTARSITVTISKTPHKCIMRSKCKAAKSKEKWQRKEGAMVQLDFFLRFFFLPCSSLTYIFVMNMQWQWTNAHVWEN